MTAPTLVEFPIKARLNDIPAKLRQLADQLEAPDVDVPVTLVLVQGYDNGFVQVGCYGDNPSKWELVGLLTLAADKFDGEEGGTVRVSGPAPG